MSLTSQIENFLKASEGALEKSKRLQGRAEEPSERMRLLFLRSDAAALCSRKARDPDAK